MGTTEDRQRGVFGSPAALKPPLPSLTVISLPAIPLVTSQAKAPDLLASLFRLDFQRFLSLNEQVGQVIGNSHNGSDSRNMANPSARNKSVEGNDSGGRNATIREAGSRDMEVDLSPHKDKYFDNLARALRTATCHHNQSRLSEALHEFEKSVRPAIADLRAALIQPTKPSQRGTIGYLGSPRVAEVRQPLQEEGIKSGYDQCVTLIDAFRNVKEHMGVYGIPTNRTSPTDQEITHSNTLIKLVRLQTTLLKAIASLQDPANRPENSSYTEHLADLCGSLDLILDEGPGLAAGSLPQESKPKHSLEAVLQRLSETEEVLTSDSPRKAICQLFEKFREEEVGDMGQAS